MKKMPSPAKAETKNILKKNVSVIHINAKLSLLQRKLVNALLFNAYERLLTDDTHSINVALLSEMIGFDSKNVAYLKSALTGMVETSVEWDILEDDGTQSWEVSSLLSSAKIRGGTCSYRYDKSLAEKLFHPDIYSKINLSVVKHMKSSYALILYENCHRFLGTGNTGWWEIDTFRKIMGVDDGSYTQFKFLNRDIIKPAIIEVNKLSNIQIDYETSRKGRLVTGVRFSVKPNAQMSLLEMEEDDQVSETAAFKALLKFGVSKTLARSWVMEFGEEYVLDKVEYTKAQAASGRIKSSKSGFLKSALENNYVSETETNKAQKEAVEQKKFQKNQLEQEIATKEAIWRNIERETRKRSLAEISDAFDALPETLQSEKIKEIESQLSGIHLGDFKKNGWNSMLSYKVIRSVWENNETSLPVQDDIAREMGIADVAVFQRNLSDLKKNYDKI